MQIEGGAQRTVHVERHRAVFMDDLPRAAHALQAQRLAHPEADGSLGPFLRPGHAKVDVAEGHVAADGDLQTARLEVDRRCPGVVPGLLFFDVDSVMG